SSYELISSHSACSQVVGSQVSYILVSSNLVVSGDNGDTLAHSRLDTSVCSIRAGGSNQDTIRLGGDDLLQNLNLLVDVSLRRRTISGNLYSIREVSLVVLSAYQHVLPEIGVSCLDDNS